MGTEKAKLYGKWVIFKTSGRVDSDALANFKRSVDRELEGHTHPVHFAFDFSDLEFLSIPAIQFINGLAINMTSQGGQFAVLGCNDRIRKHLEIFGELKLLRLVQNSEELNTQATIYEQRLQKIKEDYEREADSAFNNSEEASAL